MLLFLLSCFFFVGMKWGLFNVVSTLGVFFSLLVKIVFFQTHMLFLRFIVNVLVVAFSFLYFAFPVYFLGAVSFCHSQKCRPVVFSHWECFLHNIARVVKIGRCKLPA